MSSAVRLSLSLSQSALAILLVACHSGQETTGSRQVVAKIQDDEVTVHQLNFELTQQQSQVPDNEPAEKRQRQVAQALVDRELLANQALDAQLERQPDVVLALDRARREVLAKAYMDTVLSRVTPPSDAAIHAYYEAHPELFSARASYQLDRITTGKPFPLAQVQARLQKDPNVDAMVKWLTAEQDIPVTRQTVLVTAEQLPLVFLPRISQLKAGEYELFDAGGNVLLIRLLDKQMQPLDETQAKPMISAFLLNEARQKAGSAEVDRLRALADVKWFGPFESLAAKEGDTQKPVDPAQAQAINRGIAGLK